MRAQEITMRKRPGLSVVEKIAAKQATAPRPINPADIANLIFGAKHGLMHLDELDAVNVATSIANVSALLREMPAGAAPAPAPADDLAAAAQAAAKG